RRVHDRRDVYRRTVQSRTRSLPTGLVAWRSPHRSQLAERWTAPDRAINADRAIWRGLMHGQGVPPADRNVRLAGQVVIRPADFGAVDAERLTGEYHAELRQRFPSDYDPAKGLPATANDLRAPNGVFVVARDD